MTREVQREQDSPNSIESTCNQRVDVHQNKSRRVWTAQTLRLYLPADTRHLFDALPEPTVAGASDLLVTKMKVGSEPSVGHDGVMP